ncbi:MAG: single-stranded DNA-binding protein [Prevotella sp.]|nr:single-stranded DNA-binding protein [Prevotella sp.]
MANTITGKVIAFTDIETIQSTDPAKQPMTRRRLFIDCTRYDPYTGERGYENTPLLEFGGKSLEKLEALIQRGLKKDDIVTISFDIQGSRYTNKTTGKQDVFTRVRPYDIEIAKPRQTADAPAPAVPAATTAPAPQPATSQDGTDGLPF